MPRLTREEIERYQAWLTEWRTPVEMLKYVEEVNDAAGRYFLIQAGLAFLRDAWAAATFANIHGASEVRLVAEEWPDFELKFRDDVETFEFTEADVPGRKRGQEYQEAEDTVGPDGIYVEDDPVEDWIARAEAAPDALRIAAETKAGKAYSGDAQLLIYLNISEFGIRQEDIECCFQESTKPAKNAFDTVWILWKGAAYKVWDKGRLCDERLTTEEIRDAGLRWIQIEVNMNLGHFAQPKLFLTRINRG